LRWGSRFDLHEMSGGKLKDAGVLCEGNNWELWATGIGACGLERDVVYVFLHQCFNGGVVATTREAWSIVEGDRISGFWRFSKAVVQ
jgi:hypothetical protein